MRSVLAYLLVALAGLAIWLAVRTVSGVTEAWDSGLFFLAGVPAMIIVSSVAGYFQPKLWWLWGLAVVSFQFVFLFWESPAGPLWFAGLVFCGIIAVPCSLGALFGKRYRDRRTETDPAV